MNDLGHAIFRVWRIVASGIAFATFGIAGLALALAFPLMKRLPIRTAPGLSDREAHELRCQRIVRWGFASFIGFMKAMGILTHDFRGAEQLREPGQIIVANHPTLLDVVFIVSQMPQADCVVKAAAWSNPFFRGVVLATGYVGNDSGEELLAVCSERLERGRSVLLFPEGTRSPENALGSFQRGAAHLALRTGRALRPVVIRCEPPSLMKGQKWYDVPRRPMHFTIDCADPIEAAPLVSPDRSRGAAARVVTAALREFYEKRREQDLPMGARPR